jgi:hypothetical protein
VVGTIVAVTTLVALVWAGLGGAIHRTGRRMRRQGISLGFWASVIGVLIAFGSIMTPTTAKATRPVSITVAPAPDGYYDPKGVPIFVLSNR